MRKKHKLTHDERKKRTARRRQAREIRSIFDHAGFKRIADASDKQITFEGTTSDIDDLFAFENLYVIVERTQSIEISSHSKKKYLLYQKILNNQSDFIIFCKKHYKGFPSNSYPIERCIVKVVYCAPDISSTLKAELRGLHFIDLVAQKYFFRVSAAIRRSSRFEIFDFLGLKYGDIGEASVKPSGVPIDTYSGSLLPESSSSFPEGFKVVSFYVDPDALLTRIYVLRTEGWRDRDAMFQRIVSKSKIDKLREYHRTQGRVFVNNVIVTLPHSTKVVDDSGNTVDARGIVKTSRARIQLPREFNSIGIIDGQHRVLSYHEGGKYEDKVSKLRKKQNLLVTGVIYPEAISMPKRTQFEAKLFLEINATQTSAKSQLKQEIEVLLEPFSEISIAKRVVNHMNEHGPLAGKFERYSFEEDKIKTTSIVSYGVRNIIRFKDHGATKGTLYSVWTNDAKGKIGKHPEAAELYVKYCAMHIGYIISALKQNLPVDRWTTDKKVPGRVLSTTVINGMIVCLRRIIEEDVERSLAHYAKRLKHVQEFKFGDYKSSQYGSLGRALFDKYFA